MRVVREWNISNRAAVALALSDELRAGSQSKAVIAACEAYLNELPLFERMEIEKSLSENHA